MQRPSSIINFERSFWTSTLLGFGGFLYSWNTISDLVGRDPTLSRWDGSMGFVMGAVLVSFAISILLWYLVGRRASNIAKWIYVLFMGFGLLSTLGSFNDPAAPKGIGLVISLTTSVFTAASIYFLFRPDARAWFSKTSVDPATFE